MKKILSFVAAIMIATTATAQTAMELARQQQELNAINMKMLNAKPTKQAKKQAKELKAEGWTVPAGDIDIAQQVTRSQLYSAELTTDESGNVTKRYIMQTAQQTAGTYNSGYAAARAAAQAELAAMGAKYGCPDQLVFNIAGDGCFRMNLNELATASRYNIPIIEVVLNNHVLGMVRQWQTLFYGERYSATVLHDKVDFCKVAEGLGCKAIRVTKKEEVMPALQEAVDYHGPVVIECIIDDDDKVFPMVAPGSSIAEVFDEADINK